MVAQVAAPVAVEGTIALALFLGWAVSFGLLWAWRESIAKAIIWAADELDRPSIPTPFGRRHVLGPVASTLRAVDHRVQHGLGVAVLNTERGAVWLLDLVRRQFAWIGQELGGLAYDVAHRFHVVSVIDLPNLWTRTMHAMARDRARVAALAATVAHAVAVDIPQLGREVADVRGYTRRLLRRLRRVERLLAPAAFAAAVAVALGRLGLNWIRCPALNRISRRHGCAPWRLLELLLAPTVTALTLYDMCSLVKLIQRGAILAEPFLEEVVVTGESFLCGGDSNLASAIVAADRSGAQGYASGVVAADLRG